MAEHATSGSESPREKNRAKRQQPEVNALDDADMYEDYDPQGVASALADYMAENGMEGAVSGDDPLGLGTCSQ